MRFLDSKHELPLFAQVSLGEVAVHARPMPGNRSQAHESIGANKEFGIIAASRRHQNLVTRIHAVLVGESSWGVCAPDRPARPSRVSLARPLVM